MNENEVVVQTLNTMLQRHAKVVQAYEVEIANLMAEIFRLKSQLENPEKAKAPSKNS
jgi:hypothetical protein